MATNKRSLLATIAVIGALALGGCGGSHPGSVSSDGGGAALDGNSDGAGSADAESSDGPNVIPGQCVLSGTEWTCGTGYGSFPACPGGGYPALGDPCFFDAGVCFACNVGIGYTFGCVLGSYTVEGPVGTGCL